MPDAANVIRMMCPDLSCQRVLSVPADARGKLVRCKACGTTIRIPMQKTGGADESASQATSESSSN